MLKYELIPEQLLYEGTIHREQLFEPSAIDRSIVLKTHCPAYLSKLLELKLNRNEERRMGFPQSSRLVLRELTITQGTLECAYHALDHGVALNVSGGTHHAFYARGEGFCLLNDVAVAVNQLLDEGTCRQIAVVDLDVHQGNGTAALFYNRPEVFTLSFHGADNFPLHKEQSDLDVHLPTGTGDDEYLKLLTNHIEPLLIQFQPDLVFYVAGVDVLDSDRLGRLSLTLEGCKERDRLIFEACASHRIPVVVVMGGGYSHRIADIVQAHCNTYRMANRIYG